MKVCMIATLGGHLAQLECILPALDGNDRYLVTIRSPHADSVFPGTARYYVRQILRNPANLVVNFLQSLRLLLHHRPDVVVTTGAGDALPTAILAAALGVRVIFIESFARVHHPSLFGRLIHRWADFVLIQWPGLRISYRNAILVSPVFGSASGAGAPPPTHSLDDRILVLTGTHTRGFERLLKSIDEQVEIGKLRAIVRAQIGHSEYVPRSLSWFRFLPHDALVNEIREADVVVTHDGAASIGEAISLGKRTIVVPRKRTEGEVSYESGQELARELAERGVVEVVDDPNRLHEALEVGPPSGGTQPVETESAVEVIQSLLQIQSRPSLRVSRGQNPPANALSRVPKGMRVVVVSPVNPSETRASGVRLYVEALTSSLVDSGNHVTIVSPGPPSRPPNRGIDHVVLRARNSSSTAFLAALAISAFRIGRSGSVFHFQRLDHIVPLLPWLCRKQVVATLHGDAQLSISIRKGVLQSALMWLLEVIGSVVVDRCIAVDADTKEEYSRQMPWLKQRIEEIPVGVWFPQSPKLAEAQEFLENIPSRAKVVMFAGRLSPEKNTGLLLESFEKLLIHLPEAYLLVVGEGPEQGVLERQVEALGRSRARLVPVVTRPILAGLLMRADVLAITSMFESGPLVALEAISLGTPVVSTPVGRLRGVLGRWEVGQISKADPLSFARALEEVLSRGKAHYAPGCRDASGALSFAKTYAMTSQLYSSIIGAREARSG